MCSIRVNGVKEGDEEEGNKWMRKREISKIGIR